MDRNRSAAAPLTISIIQLFLWAYLASYAALLVTWQITEEDGYDIRVPTFRAGGRFADVAYSPLIWIDRQLRPNFWGQPSDLSTLWAEESPHQPVNSF